MNNLRFLFAAYMAVWILLAVYLYFLHSREKRLREELRRLQRMLEKSGSGQEGERETANPTNRTAQPPGN